MSLENEQLSPQANPGDGVHERPLPGRGTLTNRAGRFERHQTAAFDDGWRDAANDDPPARLDTIVTFDKSRSIIARNDSPDIGFDRSINPYRGCEHGCVYCFARPTHAWLGLSPGLDFESRLFAKADAARLLEQELSRPGYRPRPIALGTNTDPYQPIERRLKITRSVLEVLAAHDHPVTIVTKGAGVVRDLDILAPMAAKGLASVAVSVTTLDAGLAEIMEPRAARPERRIETIRMLAAAGVPTSVMVAPVIPAINDHEIEAILIRARQAGAKHANYILLRLPRELRELFGEWLTAHFPERKRRVLNRLREMRGGELYRSGFGERMRGSGHDAELLARRFQRACRQQGYEPEKSPLDSSRFSRPQESAGNRQLSLFGPATD